MAIEKSNAQVQTLRVLDDGGVMAKVNIKLADGGTQIAKAVLDVTISNATSGEKTAFASLVSKAAALAVAQEIPLRISTDDLQVLRQSALDLDMARLRFGDVQEYVTTKYGLSTSSHVLDFITGEIRIKEQDSSNGAMTDIEELKNTVKETP